MLKTCPKCGKYLSEEAAACPTCGHILIAKESKHAAKEGKEEEKASETITAESYDPIAERVLLYSLMKPAIENFKQCKAAQSDILQHLRVFEKALSPKSYEILSSHVSKTFDEEIKNQKEMANYNATKALEAFSRYQTAMSSSSYKGLGFSVITDTAGAVAYSALNTLEGIKHDLMQANAAGKQFLSDIENLSTDCDCFNYLKPILKVLDEIATLISDLFEAKEFVAAHRDFYQSAFTYDLGITVAYQSLGTQSKQEEVNVYDALRKCISFNHPEEFIGEILFASDPLKHALHPLECAGYIRAVGSFYFTTCAYERKVLQALEQVKNPQAYTARMEKQAAHNLACRKEAEQYEKAGNLWRAAVTLGKTIDDDAAMTKSIALWNEFYKKAALPIQTQRYSGFWLTDGSGTLRSVLSDKLYYEYTHLDRHKEIHQIPYVKQWALLPDSGSLILTYDGQVQIHSISKLKGSILKKIPSFRDSISFVYTKAIAANNMLIGLRADGTVTSIGTDAFVGWQAIANRKDIKCIAGNTDTIAAITQDGTLLTAGAAAELSGQEKHPNTKSLFVTGYNEKYIISGITEEGNVWATGSKSEMKNFNTDEAPTGIVGKFDTIYYKPNGELTTFGSTSQGFHTFCASLKNIVKIGGVIVNLYSVV